MLDKHSTWIGSSSFGAQPSISSIEFGHASCRKAGLLSRCHHCKCPRTATQYVQQVQSCTQWKLYKRQHSGKWGSIRLVTSASRQPDVKCFLCLKIRELGRPEIIYPALPSASRVGACECACALGSCMEGMIGIKGWRAGCADGIAAAERQDVEAPKRGVSLRASPCASSALAGRCPTCYGGAGRQQGGALSTVTQIPERLVSVHGKSPLRHAPFNNPVPTVCS